MTTDVVQTQEEDTQVTSQVEGDKASSEELESAFEAGFNKSLGEEPTDETPAETNDADNNDEQPPESPVEVITEQQAEKLFAGKSETEIQSLLDKVPGLESRLSDETRKLYGRFGDVQSRLQRIEERASKPLTREISVEAFGELSDEYGPELAGKIVAGLQKIFAGQAAAESQPVAPAAPAVDVDAMIQSAVDRVRDEQERKLLTVMHKDWQTIPGEKEFPAFLASLPGEPVSVTREDGSVIKLPAEAAKYVESNDALVAAECFTKYKEWKSAQQKSSSRNQNRLEAAITPTGGGAPPASTIDDEAAFLRGFKRARGTG